MNIWYAVFFTGKAQLSPNALFRDSALAIQCCKEQAGVDGIVQPLEIEGSSFSVKAIDILHIPGRLVLI
jgi:hypothetical protein